MIYTILLLLYEGVLILLIPRIIGFIISVIFNMVKRKKHVNLSIGSIKISLIHL